MKHWLIIATFIVIFTPSTAYSDQQCITNRVDNAALVGKSRMKVLFWNIYDIALYAPNGNWTSSTNFALSLTYLRSFKAQNIAERSILEIRKQGFTDEQMLEIWYERMLSIFPDIEKHDRLSAIALTTGTTLFCQDETIIGEIQDAIFTQQFFNIWLSQKTSAPKTRKDLLGL